MKRILVAVAILSTFTLTLFAGRAERIHVKVIKVEEGTSQGAEGYYTPTRISLQMPDGRIVIGSCVYRWGTKQYHPCGYPVSEADAEVKTNSIDLYWSASLDDKKLKSEHYKIEQVIKALK